MKSRNSLILICIITMLGNIAYAQKSNIGLNLKFNNESGLNTEARYEFNLSRRWLAGLSFSTNFQNSTSYRFGFKYELVSLNSLSFLTGLDYKMRFIKYHIAESQYNTQHILEIPLELRYKISSSYSIFGGISIPMSLQKNRAEEYSVNNFRLGIIRSF